MPKQQKQRYKTSRENKNLAKPMKKKIQDDEPKYTPLEQQYLAIKKSNPDAVLFVECGYKYRFFGKDAEIASKELNICCNPDHNFHTASIPVHRLFVHVRRLVSNGHKVGVVKQTETAALKAAGNNKSAPFQRELTALYTKATLIGEDVDPVFSVENDQHECITSNKSTAGHLMCIYEGQRSENTQNIAIVSIMLSTGEIIYDSFTDDNLRNQLQNRIVHIEPVEILLPDDVTEATKIIVSNLSSSVNETGDKTRIERIKNEFFDEDLSRCKLSELIKSRQQNQQAGPSSNSDCDNLDILKLPTLVICCLHGLISYLKDFNLDHMLIISKNFHQFNPYSNFLHLDACAVRNLELFNNRTDSLERGSLFSVIDHTKTRFGKRLLRRWLSRPLRDHGAITSRLDAVDELNDAPDCMKRLYYILCNFSDIEKALASIIHKRCSTYEFYLLCSALSQLERVTQQDTVNYIGLQSDLLKMLSTGLTHLLTGASEWISVINEEAAKSGDKTQLFVDSKYPEIVAAKVRINDIIQNLNDHRQDINTQLQIKGFEYSCVSGVEFLIEVKNNNLGKVPKDWLKMSSTRAVSRYQSPFIIETFRELCQAREKLADVCNKCWHQYLQRFESFYPQYQQAIEYLATIDCLFSFAYLSKSSGFSRPEVIAEECVIEIAGGRHPVVDMLLGEQDQYVPNDTSMKSDHNRCMIITGPNMGGKSSYIRQVAIICILSQMGCYVPAESARLGILDAIYTRMGAEDDLYRGTSTFMMELQETSLILQKATEKSLVILDELGRGTSTHDGMAIAYATLNHIISHKKSLCMFVTHYLPLTQLEKVYPLLVRNYHMAFIVEDESDISDRAPCDCVAFLYQLVEGPSERSYGLNVARLADIPTDIIKSAQHQSQQLERKLKNAQLNRNFFSTFMQGSTCEVISAINKMQSNKLICD